VAIGLNTTVTEDNVVGVGNRRITQVSDGIADTDAVNVSQLRNGMQTVYNNAKAYTDSSVTNIKTYADGKARDAEKNANAYTDNKVSASEKTVKAYADERANVAERNANAYTDKAIMGITSGTNGLNSHGYKVTNVADGDISPTSTDAVNGRQVYHLTEELRGEIAQVGAQSAALANLKPIFTDDSRVSAAVGVGNYKGATSAALGAFYRPDENTMISLSGAIGNSTNMVGVGFSYAFGGSSKAKKKKTSDSDEVAALKDLVRSMQQRIEYLEQKLG
jgi:autotransporter adhesin